jgi:hypothetical protein
MEPLLIEEDMMILHIRLQDDTRSPRPFVCHIGAVNARVCRRRQVDLGGGCHGGYTSHAVGRAVDALEVWLR